jgi:hypothetical protein
MGFAQLMPVAVVEPVGPGRKASKASIAGASAPMWETAATEAVSNACAGSLEDAEVEDAEVEDAEVEDALPAWALTALPPSSSESLSGLSLPVSLSPVPAGVFAPALVFVVAAAFATACALLLGGGVGLVAFAAFAAVFLVAPILRLCIKIVSRIVEEWW